MAPGDTEIAPADNELTLRYMTPHGKWNIHTMYYDNLEMLTLFRGGPNVWLSPVDADKAGIKDNDWLEIYNRNGVVTARAVVSHRMPAGPCTCIMRKTWKSKNRCQRLQVIGVARIMRQPKFM